MAAAAASQLALPALAARAIRRQLARDGTVVAVGVKAFPALALLWGHAQALTVTLADYRVSVSALRGLLAQGGAVDQVTVRIGSLSAGALRLRSVEVSIRGSVLEGVAQITTADLQAALPVLGSIEALSGPAGPLMLRGSVAAFGLRASATVLVLARDGKVIVVPQGRLGLLGTITVFDQPDIRVRALHGAPTPGGVAIAASAELK